MVKQASNGTKHTYGSIIMNNDGPEESGGRQESTKLGGGAGLVVDDSSCFSLADGGSHQNLTTSSWSPSPHSTSRSSRENLDLLLKYHPSDTTSTEDDSVALLANAGGTTSLLCDCTNGKNKKALEQEGKCSAVTSFLARHCCSRRMALLGLGLLVACSLYVVGRYSNTTIPLLVDHNHDGDDDLAADTTSATVTTKREGKKSMAALSLLDPVRDLGLAAYERPESSRPPKALADSPYTVYPTNAWYQNLLMLGKDGDTPQDIHRVYCIPYIIDAAGKIAGLRLHGVYRTVSNTVIQLNTQNEFGLTIGAKVNHDNGVVVEPTTDDHGDHDDKPTISRGYTIHTATPLGVTLEWVRVCVCVCFFR
jgi:hypothetical protein